MPSKTKKTDFKPEDALREPLLLPQDALIYDAEIIKCIPDKGKPNDENYEYCQGWGDHKGMGISCICAFDLFTRMPHVFLKDNFDEFQDLVAEREYVIGFNSKHFDDKLCAAHGLKVQTTFDLHCEYKIAMGYGANARIIGSGLDPIAMKQFGVGKSEKAKGAPQMWQDGEHGRVINYCMRDVMLTMKILLRGHNLVSIESGKLMMPLRSLFEAKHDGKNGRIF
jgi:hypothetical protein